MFRRRKDAAESKQNPCPFCGFDNAVDAKSCSQCYFEFEKPMRDQGSMPSADEQNEVYNLLMAETEEFNQDDDYAIEAVLSLDEVNVDIDQFEPTSFDDEAPEQFQFIASEGPTLNEVKEYQKMEEVTIESSDVRPNAQSVDLQKFDPIASVPEPIPEQGGKIVSGPNMDIETNRDIDAGQIVGGIEIPETPPREEKISMSQAIVEEQSQTQAIMPPSIPDIDEQLTPPTIPDIGEEETISSPPSDSIKEMTPPPVPDIDEDFAITPPEIPKQALSEAPEPENPSLWPWAQRETWTNGQLDQILIEGFSLVKSGQIQKSADCLDQIGPHIGDNLDKLYHVGLLMKEVGRAEALKEVLDRAERLYPTDQRVRTAVEHLS
ncbi:MAG: hypothetical protein CMB73_08215 [Euryarchaeota archaeon]|nr:hypothetical protein [Euryarchaeota archaeon]|tara:strand:+ start:3801 stop:4934 length:1134 start_codon:yes stop_codon:yes gene_type:complete